jgi:hypothetical protein
MYFVFNLVVEVFIAMTHLKSFGIFAKYNN